MKHLLCLIVQGRPFRTISNLDENVNDFAKNTLGYVNATMVTKDKANGYKDMTIAQVQQILAWITLTITQQYLYAYYT